MPFSRIKRSEEERSISTVTVVVACVLEKGRICQILHALHSVATMASFGLGHVKRVKRQNQKWLVILHPRKALSFPTPDCVSDCQLAEAQVSAHAAVTREQFVVWSKIWPLTFHPIAGCNLQDPISPTLFEEAFKRDVISGRLQAALFDDQCNEVVSVSAANEPKRSFLGHPIMLLIEKMSERSRHSVSPSSQYLCTGLTLLVRQECCIACGMALVHSRIGRVLFLERNQTCGSFVTKCHIGQIPGLNHRFPIYEWACSL